MADLSDVQKQIMREGIGLTPILIAAVVAIGVLVVVLFAPILGVQATELAKLVQDAESDLTALIKDVPTNGTFWELLPKFIIFNILLVGWVLISNTVTVGLTETFASRRWQLWIAIAVSSTLPVVVLAKYWIANWIGASERLQAAYPLLDLLPPVAPGGLWIFAGLLVLETAVLQGLWARYRARQPDADWAVASLPVFFAGAIGVFLIGSLLLRFGPPLVASGFGTINIVVLYVTLLYAFVGGLMYYLRTNLGFRIITGVVVYLIAVNSLHLFVTIPQVGRPSIVEIAPPAAGAEAPDQFTAWYRHRAKGADPARPFPVFVIAASGGGMRATIRTTAFLEHMGAACPDFLRHTFAISSVSGGALGSLLFVGQQQVETGPPRTGCDIKGSRLSRGELPGRQSASLLDAFFDTDVTPAIVGPGLFTEVFQRFLPPGILPQFDRSNSFHDVMAASWRDTVDTYVRRTGARLAEAPGCAVRDFLGRCDSNSYWRATGNVPLLVFNATSATDGGLVPLTNVDLDYFAGLPMSGLVTERIGRLPRFNFGLLSGASASARFPVALPAATLQDIDGNIHTLVDGGYFDNSGLLVARAIKQRIQVIAERSRAAPASEPINAQVFIVYLHETERNKVACETTTRWHKIAARAEGDFQNAELAHLNALVRVRDKSSLMTQKLIDELEGRSIINFEWDLHEPPIVATEASAPGAPRHDCGSLREHSPLAFYYAPTTRFKFKLFLENELLEKNGYSLDEVQKLLRPPG
jgi:hypothetical protein